MKIPFVPSTPLVDKTGNVTVEWRLYFEQLTNQLQVIFSENGYIFPFKTNAELADLVGSDLEGRQIFASEQLNMQVNTTGVYKPLVTYEELTTAAIAAIPSGERNGRIVYNTDTTDLFIGSNDTFVLI